jgi:hypothetical protein
MNKVLLAGRLERDPEMRALATRKHVKQVRRSVPQQLDDPHREIDMVRASDERALTRLSIIDSSAPRCTVSVRTPTEKPRHVMATMSAPSNLTRRSAIDAVRQTYQTLSDRALRRARDDDARGRYVKDLAAAWMERLAELGDIGRLDTSLPEHARKRVESLTAAINAPLEDEDLYRWLDAFPEAVAELLPPSASTFRAEPDDRAQPANDDTAALKQAALALAA